MKNGHSRLLNVISISILAFFSTQLLHELTHLVTARLLGYNVLGFHLFAVNIDFINSANEVWRFVIVEASASILNILICLIAVILFYLLNHGYAKLSAMLIVGFQGMMGFGYLLFDGIFYAPGSVGDWKSVIDVFGGSASLRIVLVLVGTIGYMMLFFWLGKVSLSFVASHQRNLDRERARVGFEILVLPYILSVAFNVPLAFWHPLGGSVGFFVIFFQYIFGYSGFLTGFLMLWQWLDPKTSNSSGTVIMTTEPEYVIWILAGIAVILHLYLIFNTVYFV
jgi:hypothetical protein